MANLHPTKRVLNSEREATNQSNMSLATGARVKTPAAGCLSHSQQPAVDIRSPRLEICFVARINKPLRQGRIGQEAINGESFALSLKNPANHFVVFGSEMPFDIDRRSIPK
ncbi:MAG TPA: hypothetical protein VF777_14275 [Phycisphaerales bacterium]